MLTKTSMALTCCWPASARSAAVTTRSSMVGLFLGVIHRCPKCRPHMRRDVRQVTLPSGLRGPEGDRLGDSFEARHYFFRRIWRRPFAVFHPQCNDMKYGVEDPLRADTKPRSVPPCIVVPDQGVDSLARVRVQYGGILAILRNDAKLNVLENVQVVVFEAHGQ